MKINILIVEDHELTRFGLKTTFEGVDYIDNIYEAESAEKALEILDIPAELRESLQNDSEFNKSIS